MGRYSTGLLMMSTLPVALAAGAPAARAVPPAAPAAPAAALEVSPTKVLAADRGRTGQVYIQQGPRDALEATGGRDRSLAPYLYVANGDPTTDRLPLKETSGDINIAGVIARVRVRQVFANHGSKPIEAVYVFPASTRAAVHGMRMKIGKRVVEAKIDRRAAARAAYETARQEGRRASLLEQQRPNVFTMNVANILPGDRIEVELDYSELLVPENATYELVYPTVVGPRYTGGAHPGRDQSRRDAGGFAAGVPSREVWNPVRVPGDQWMANPHLPEGQRETYAFDVRVHLETGIPLKELASPSHKVAVSYTGPARADVRLDERGGGNRDFVLRYRLAGDRVETGALLWQGDSVAGRREGFFSVLMEPPQRPAAAEIPPREYIFLLDVSGSMHGFPLDTAKALMRRLLPRLRPTDLFNIALFSGASFVMSPDGSVPATSDNLARAIQLIDGQRGGGGTELMGGLEASYRIPKRVPSVSRTVVVVTDGYVGVEAQAFRFIRERLDDANLFAFGIGSSVNRALIEGMARAGQGEPFVVLKPEKAEAEAERFRAYIEQPVLTDIKVAFEGLEVSEVAPGRLPDLLAERPLVLFGRYAGDAEGRIKIVGRTGRGRFEKVMELKTADARAENGALQWLWARKWVELLEDEHHLGAGKPIEEAITGLGLAYRLLTPFTSFVSVDSQIVNPGGGSESVRQPLPMPEGVSNLAVASNAVAHGVIGRRASGPLLRADAAKKLQMEGGGAGYGSGAGGDALGGLDLSTGTVGVGKGGGGRSRALGSVAAERPAPAPAHAAPARPVSPAPPPPPAPKAAPEPSVARDKDDARDETYKEREARQERKPAAPAPATVVVVKAKGLSDTAPLVRALEALVARLAGSCLTAGTEVRARLHIDAGGAVAKVELLSAPASARACLIAALAKLATTTKALSPASGSIEITLRN